MSLGIGMLYFGLSLVFYVAIIYAILRFVPKTCVLLFFVVLHLYKDRRATDYLELIDYDWMPSYLINYEQIRMWNQMEALYSHPLILNSFSENHHIKSKLESVLADNDRVFAIGSGAGGVLPFLFQEIHPTRNTTIVMTDLTPHVEQYEKLKTRFSPFVDSIDESVDIFNLPESTVGRPLIIAATLHHFKPDMVREVFKSAIKNRSPILILDGASSMSTVLLLPLQALSFSFATGIVDGIREMDLPLLLLTCSGILPAVAFHDNVVSALRFYSEHDLKNILRTIPESSAYDWDWSAMKLRPLALAVGAPAIAKETCKGP